MATSRYMRYTPVSSRGKLGNPLEMDVFFMGIGNIIYGELSIATFEKTGGYPEGIGYPAF
jgi:hypothetical protein